MYIPMCVGMSMWSGRTKVNSSLFQSTGEGLELHLWPGFFSLNCRLEGETYFLNTSNRRSTILYFFQRSFHGPCAVINLSGHYKHPIHRHSYRNWSSCVTVIGHQAIWPVTTHNASNNK